MAGGRGDLLPAIFFVVTLYSTMLSSTLVCRGLAKWRCAWALMTSDLLALAFMDWRGQKTALRRKKPQLGSARNEEARAGSLSAG
jgi:hypothetical protein